jgi:arylsulfatase A-like enzyme
MDGKFLINWQYATKPPPNFDHFADFAGGYTNVRWNVDGNVQTSSQYVTDFQSDRAIDFLNDFHQSPNRPWYLYLTPEAPHEPMIPAPQYANAPLPPWQPSPAVGADRSSKPDFIRNQNDSMTAAQTARDAQLRTLLSVDDMMDRIMQHLSDTGQLDNTLVIYTGDSGWLFSEYGLRSKSVPYLHSVHVPFYVRWPAGGVAPGAVDHRPMEHVDIAPTILQATGTSPSLKYPMDGRSFLSSDLRTENLLEYHWSPDFKNTPSWAAIRSDAFDYIEWYQDDAGTQIRAREYYDLTKDPWELVNLLGDTDTTNDPAPATLADLAARLARYRVCNGTTGSTACP